MELKNEILEEIEATAQELQSEDMDLLWNEAVMQTIAKHLSPEAQAQVQPLIEAHGLQSVTRQVIDALEV